MTIKDGTCPYCKLVVRYDDEEKTLAHEVPSCAEFMARIARDFPRVYARWLAEVATDPIPPREFRNIPFATGGEEREAVLQFLRKEADRMRGVANDYTTKHNDRQTARKWLIDSETIGRIANCIERGEHVRGR